MNYIKRYAAYLKDNPEGLWFKRKLYGYGWMPAKWQGWAVVVLYIAAIVCIFPFIDARQHSGSDTLINFALPFIILSVIVIIICYKKGNMAAIIELKTKLVAANQSVMFMRTNYDS